MSFWDLFDEMEKEMNKMRKHYNKLLSFSSEQLPAINNKSSLRMPLSDIRETENNILIELEMPGIDKKDVDINLTEDELEIRAEHKGKMEEKKKNYYRMERDYSGFYRRFALPAKIKTNEAKAEMKDGILTVTLPKQEKKKTNKIKLLLK